MTYVVLITHNEGGGARLYDTLDQAKRYVRGYLVSSFFLDGAYDEIIDADERRRIQEELDEMDKMDPKDFGVLAVRGADAWKEWLYIAEVSE
jgi:hypothetical protein